MARKIRNAGASGETAGETFRKVSPVPKESSSARKTVRVLPGQKKAGEQIPEALGLVIPCRIAEKPDRIKPTYLVETNKLGGVERGFWQCEQCSKIYRTRKAWAKHAGTVSNIMGTCPALGG